MKTLIAALFAGVLAAPLSAQDVSRDTPLDRLTRRDELSGWEAVGRIDQIFVFQATGHGGQRRALGDDEARVLLDIGRTVPAAGKPQPASRCEDDDGKDETTNAPAMSPTSGGGGAVGTFATTTALVAATSMIMALRWFL